MSENLPKGGEFLISETKPEDVFTPEDFSDEQKDIANMTEDFVMNEVVPRIEEIDEQKFDVTISLLKQCGELGLLSMDAPEEYEGLEFDKATVMLVMEKMGPGGSFSVAYAAHTGLGTLPLIYYGTKEQKDKYLKKIITGEWISGYALTEPGAGTDALNIKTNATLSEDGKYYILNGTKQFITNAGFADIFFVFAKVDRKDFAAFIVEKNFEGLSLGPEEKKMGIKGSSTRQLILDNVKVPVENVLGEIGKGHKIAFNILNVGRFKLGAAVTGAGKYAFSEALKYANQRQQFNTPIAKFGALKEKFADMVSELYAAESVVYRLAGLLDKKIETIPKDAPDYYTLHNKGIEEYAIECSISKVFCSEVLGRVVDEVIQSYGGYGFIAEYPAERFYRDERINRIFEGTNEINRYLIPGMLLRRAMKGELPLTKKAMEALQALMTPSFDEIDDSIPFAKEKLLLKNLKTLFLIVAGSAVQKFMDKIKYEEEILLQLADMIINIFALESGMLRAEKMLSKVKDEKKTLLNDVVKSIAFMVSERCGTAGRKVAHYIEEGDNLTMLLSGIRRFTKYDATGLLESRRRLADKASEEEKYFF